ncbi:MAG TPA: hypothetical protein VHM20_02065, partial [Gammaproteobacteria bacterium]|nr:hypothetical protein [Gammaproteobacteria bacterium]
MQPILIQNKKEEVRILIALWGEKYINDFLKLNLRSLLASGNIPALVNAYSSHFIVLTTEEDIPIFKKNLVFKQLNKICPVSFITINDLIVFSNYSTTLTLAYDRAVKSTGEMMLNTYFIFLTADYIMADGSFEGLIRYIKKGYSGICAGNFQVVEEQLKPYLIKQINPATQSLSLKPRELLKRSFKSLHPISFTNIYHQNLTHNYYANRFFLKVNNDLIAARFYLLHMICIKPETMDYKVGASCDYSFIPEMCPSGNIGIINDSDDYLVVEMQPRNQDAKFIQSGAYDFNKLASALSEWTTKQHRENAKHTIYYHTTDLLAEEKKKIEEDLDKLIKVKLKKLYKYKAKPHYQHPYWIGAIKAFKQQKAVLQNTLPYEYLNLTVLNNTTAKKIYYKLFGLPPFVRFYHHRWNEYRMVKNQIAQYTSSEPKDEIAVFYESYENDFMQYSYWFKKSLEVNNHFYIKKLMHAKNKLKELKKSKFKVCILMIRLECLSNIKEILRVLYPLVKNNGKVLIFIPNHRNFASRISYNFSREFIHYLSYIHHSPFKVNKIHTIHNNLTFLGEAIMHQIKLTYAYNKKIKFIFFGLCAIPCVLIAIIRNLLLR